MTELLYELIGWLKATSSVVWGALVKQVYANTFEIVAWAVISGFIAKVFFGVAKKLLAKSKEDKRTAYRNDDMTDSDWATLSSSILGVVFAIIASGLLIYAAKMLYNPEYYAIKMILDNLR